MILDRLFAAGYDKLLAGTEEAGLRDLRASVIGDLEGTVVEFGAGTGLNLAHYGPAVTRIIATEPDPHMAKRLRAKVQDGLGGGPSRVEIVEAGAERLPVPDGEADAVVATLVFCTIPDAPAAMREAVRVLKPGGTLRFVEHVRSSEPKSARWQDRLERPWGMIAGGCHPNRDTLAALRATEGLQLTDVRDDHLPKSPPLVRPLVVGVATRA